MARINFGVMASDVVGKIMLFGIHLGAIVELFFFFLFNAFKGAVAVALLVLKPKLKLRPLVYRVPLKTKSAFATAILVNIYSLMPGTLSMGIDGNTLSLHILDKDFMDKDFIDRVQTKVLKAFEYEKELTR